MGSVHPPPLRMRRRATSSSTSHEARSRPLACYDVFPSLSISQIYKAADWYEKTQRFQRAVAKGDGALGKQVSAFIKELAEPYRRSRVTRSSRPRPSANGSTRTSLSGSRSTRRQSSRPTPPRLSDRRIDLGRVPKVDRNPEYWASSIATMTTLAPVRSLTSVDLKDNLHDIQDNERAGSDQWCRRSRIATVGARRQTTVPIRPADLRHGEKWRIPVRPWAERAQGNHRTEVLNSGKN
ncbi:hypothetical protein BN77_p10885 [Rhizobium mesoamericanum STM3625]|uniref:Uncharacterized protein n=1 Tax=Rhizobium mesoamericanum STM3625 TaxID=1211777 RepID=K0PNV7_9HYPH|nr:hypothetical protein BN77_p10885 [Rhizobium mesoamericanum STM3625]